MKREHPSFEDNVVYKSGVRGLSTDLEQPDATFPLEFTWLISLTAKFALWRFPLCSFSLYVTVDWGLISKVWFSALELTQHLPLGIFVWISYFSLEGFFSFMFFFLNQTTILYLGTYVWQKKFSLSVGYNISFWIRACFHTHILTDKVYWLLINFYWKIINAH